MSNMTTAAAKPTRDYTDWQEGMGNSAKPEDYDQQPGKYEVEVVCLGRFNPAQWPFGNPDTSYRVRLRQQQLEPQGESESEFMRRVLIPCICRIGVAKGAEHVEFNTTRLDRADALRLARIIAEAKA